MGKEDSMQYRRILLIILVSSFLLRVILVFSGGQFFWPDEGRFAASRSAANALRLGEINIFFEVLHTAPHLLFKVIGVIPAAIQIFLELMGFSFGPSAKIPALFFNLFAVLNLWLVWAITLRFGANNREALFAVGLLSLCSSFLYYSRHILPPDTAMAFGLLSLFVGLRVPSRPIDSVLCGVLAACCFLTYNGYWLLGGFALLVHVFSPPHRLGHCIKRVCISGVSLVLPLVILLVASAVAGGDLFHHFLGFSNAANQGIFSEGWILPFYFFWHSEHFLILLWGASLIYGLKNLSSSNRRGSSIYALAGILYIYGVLVLGSVFLEKFVVYGRLARQLVPFLCILTAVFLEKLWTSSPKGKLWAQVLLALVICQAAVNFWQPFAQTFPLEFRRLAEDASDSPESGEYEIQFDHSIFPQTEVTFVLHQIDADGKILETSPIQRKVASVINDLWSDLPSTTKAEILSMKLKPLPEKIKGRTIIQRPHPQQFLPYQYEGFTPDQRIMLRETDISMRLVQRESP